MFPVHTRNSKELIYLFFRAVVWSIPVIAYRKLFRNSVFTHWTICATDIIVVKVRFAETLLDCFDRIVVHISTLFRRRQIDQLYDFAVYHPVIPQSAEWRADDTDSRVADDIVGKKLAVAQKILRIFIVNAVHIVLQRR